MSEEETQEQAESVDAVFGEEGTEQEAPETQAAPDAISPQQHNAERSDRVQRQREVRETAAEKVRTPAARPKDEKTYRIKLHNNPEIPPGGQYVGVNGRWILIVPNVEMEVPESALEVLDNAVRFEPEKDEHHRVIGTREVPRFPYTFVRQKQPEA